MNTRTKLISLFVLLTTASGFWVYCQTGTAQANASLGSLAVCNVHKAVEQYKKTLALRAALMSDQATLQAEAKAKGRKLKEMDEALAASGLLPGSSDFERRRSKIIKTALENKNFADITKAELSRRNFQINERSYQAAYKAVRKVALKKGLTLVLYKEDLTQPSQSGEELMTRVSFRRHVIFSDDAIDITAEVVEQLNTDYELGG